MKYDTTQAVSCFISIFLEELRQGRTSLSEFEEFVIALGHDVMARAQGAALELFDDELCASYALGIKIKEKQSRRLATRIGNTCFTRRICIDECGNQIVPLDEVLDLPRYARISPGAAKFLVNAGIEMSYAKAAYLLELSGGSSVSAHGVMNLLRKSGAKCEADDVACAHELYANGVLPKAQDEAEELCLEADGIYIPLQDGDRVEVKACVAYAGKTPGKRTGRIKPVRHGSPGYVRT